MFTLSIKSADGRVAPVSGDVNICAKDALTVGITGTGSAKLSADKQLSYSEWYEDFCDRKLKAMVEGGSCIPDVCSNATETSYEFEEGLFKVGSAYERPYLCTIHNMRPDSSGGFWILPGKTVDVSEDTEHHQLKISLPVHHKQPDKALLEYDRMLWRLYHCVCSFLGRLQLFAPKMPRDGANGNRTLIRSNNNMGPYLGTYIQYQLLVANWNHYAWSSCFMLDVQTIGERAAISFGYTNLNCVAYGPVKLTLTVRKSKANPNSDIEATELTIYNQGLNNTTDQNPVIEFRRLGELTDGNGYEGRNPERDGKDEWRDDIELTSEERAKNCDSTVRILLQDDNEDGKKDPVMGPEQRVCVSAAIGPCIGSDKELEGRSAGEVKLDIVGIWEIPDPSNDKVVKTFEKTKVVYLDAVYPN